MGIGTNLSDDENNGDATQTGDRHHNRWANHGIYLLWL